jgi:hypothetical protein
MSAFSLRDAKDSKTVILLKSYNAWKLSAAGVSRHSESEDDI